jgi:hypothetical protein
MLVHSAERSHRAFEWRGLETRRSSEWSPSPDPITLEFWFRRCFIPEKDYNILPQELSLQNYFVSHPAVSSNLSSPSAVRIVVIITPPPFQEIKILDSTYFGRITAMVTTKNRWEYKIKISISTGDPLVHDLHRKLGGNKAGYRRSQTTTLGIWWQPVTNVATTRKLKCCRWTH